MEDTIEYLLRNGSQTVFCFTSFGNYLKTKEMKLQKYIAMTGHEINFDPKYAISKYITDPKIELHLFNEYLKHSLSVEKYENIKSGFNCLILVDEDTSCECQILVNENKSREIKNINDYVHKYNIKIINIGEEDTEEE